MEYKETDVKNLIAIGYLSGVVDAFGKSMNITSDDMKSRMMKSNTIRSTLVDDLSNIDAVELIKSGKNIASGVLSGHSTTTSSEPHSDTLFQKAEHAIEGLFHREPTHEEHHESMPAMQEHHESMPAMQEPIVPPVMQEPIVPPVMQEPIVPPVMQEPVVPPVMQEPVVPPVMQEPVVPPVMQEPVVSPVIQEPIVPPVMQEPVVSPVVPNASVIHPMNQAAPPPVSMGGRKKNKTKKRKTKKTKKTRK